MREGLDADTLKRLPIGRRWLYVVVDVATRYVVGFVVASTQNSSSAIRALEMATRSKDDIAVAVGSSCHWVGITPESVRTDTGSAFSAKDFLRAANEIFATYFYPMVGEPGFRPYIERLFGTFTMIPMPYVPGRTFRDPKERGDYDSDSKAVLTDDQLALIFIRYILDVYHQSPHDGLNGETPENAMKRLAGTVGVPPALPSAMRRRAFGLRKERVVTARGVQFFAINYNSEELQVIRRSVGSNTVALYVDPQDLGFVSVWADSHWIEVPCSIENFNGVTLLEWLELGKVLRRRYAAQAELKSSVVFEALSAMRATSENAMAIMGVLPQVPTADQLKDLESNLYWGLSISDDAVPELDALPLAADGIGYVIGSLNDMTSEGKPMPRHEALPSPQTEENEKRNEDADTNWWRGDEQS